MDDYMPSIKLLNHILDGREYRPMLNGSNLEKHREDWRNLMRELIACPPKNVPILVEKFHTQWHVSHHYIRQLVNDDNLITEMLWSWLPRYSGPPLLLYRGENRDRYEGRMLGSAWTDKKEIARMFASGLNSCGSGGVILSTMAPSDAIIAAPSKHSIYLGEREFSLDVRRLLEITPIEYFPKSSI